MRSCVRALRDARLWAAFQHGAMRCGAKNVVCQISLYASPAYTPRYIQVSSTAAAGAALLIALSRVTCHRTSATRSRHRESVLGQNSRWIVCRAAERNKNARRITQEGIAASLKLIYSLMSTSYCLFSISTWIFLFFWTWRSFHVGRCARSRRGGSYLALAGPQQRRQFVIHEAADSRARMPNCVTRTLFDFASLLYAVLAGAAASVIIPT